MDVQNLKESVRPIMEKMIFELVCAKPENPASFMINWLQKLGGYTSNGLKVEEKAELEKLRLEIKQYRELESHEGNEDDNHSHKSFESDDEIIPERQPPQTGERGSVQRAGVSAEVYGMFNRKEDFKPKVIPKTDDQVHRIRARVLHSFLFNTLDKHDLDIVINAMEEKRFKTNENVIKQGESGDCLYVVDSGELDCFKKFSKTSDPKLVKSYLPGDAFGELALLYNSPRAATVTAKTECILWMLDRETFNHIVKEAAQKKREKYENFLKSIEILSTVEPYELLQISDALRSASFGPGEYVIREGELGDIFYIVEDGDAVATKTVEPGKPPQEVKSYGKGDYFGELALIKGEPRAANIVAKTNLRLISLDRDSFKRLLGPIEDILKRNSEKYIKFIK